MNKEKPQYNKDIFNSIDKIYQVVKYASDNFEVLIYTGLCKLFRESIRNNYDFAEFNSSPEIRNSDRGVVLEQSYELDRVVNSYFMPYMLPYKPEEVNPNDYWYDDGDGSGHHRREEVLNLILVDIQRAIHVQNNNNTTD